MKMTTKTIRSFMTSIAVNAETGSQVRIRIVQPQGKDDPFPHCGRSVGFGPHLGCLLNNRKHQEKS